MALVRAGYKVIEMWECQWDRLVENEPAVSQFLHSFDVVPPLEPREAYFGGRTGAVALHTVAGEGEEIRYSMLPSIRTLETKTQFLRRLFQFSVNKVFRMKAEHFSFKKKVLAI